MDLALNAPMTRAITTKGVASALSEREAKVPRESKAGEVTRKLIRRSNEAPADRFGDGGEATDSVALAG
jgi:hypothetical protein